MKRGSDRQAGPAKTMVIPNLPRLARTLWPLRPSQLVWRGRYALERRLPAPHICLPVSYNELELRHIVRAEAIPEVLAPRTPSARRVACDQTRLVALHAEGTFQHLNLSLPLGRRGTDW